ncbi:hypothetical protein U6A24_03930 [Aquimarina gracilis]|uniref:Four helix bundle protein n=1 Tax=Aquimarina gracilis TaxID=874422 RepID=A0ABU5ZRA7_9FLAO|nr:hypothetical protein [Aquimarina gracilis]MEB3344595.1 hypothetical protein [Aquimarina gracilis]
MRKRPRNTRLYQKALEIFTLSRSISNYLIHDMTSLQDNGEEDSHIYFTGDIIRQSDALAPRIIKAENQTFQDDRIKQANSLIHITNKLYKNCERLEQTESNGKEFLALLRKELKKFKHLQHTWIMTL